MKKRLLVVASMLTTMGAMPAVFAEDSSAVSELKIAIEQKEKELKELKDKLNELSGSASSQDGSSDKEKEGDIKGKTFTNGNIEVMIKDVFLTTERDEYNDKKFDNVLVIEYELKNNWDKDYFTGHDFELYVDGEKAEEYYIKDYKTDAISKKRKSVVKVGFAFNGEIKEIELELSDRNDYKSEPIIIPVDSATLELR